MVREIVLWVVAGMVAALGATEAGAPASAEMRRYDAPEADQGVASDGTYFYAVDNNLIGKYRIDTGEKMAYWEGDEARFPHINSCTVVGGELACAASNYPAVPQKSSVEFFSLEALAHLRSVALSGTPGSLTVMDRHDGHWWGVFANYDERGSPPGKSHRDTYLVKMDGEFQPLATWTFPEAVLARFAPSSCSGASWTAEGLLLASGHDRPEIYLLELPETGDVLRHAGTLPVTSHGQAIDIDPARPNRLWSIDRKKQKVVATRLTLGKQ